VRGNQSFLFNLKPFFGYLQFGHIVKSQLPRHHYTHNQNRSKKDLQVWAKYLTLITTHTLACNFSAPNDLLEKPTAEFGNGNVFRHFPLS